MVDHQNTVFEGWAVVELFGHTKELGYVTTLYFGNQAMFKIETPYIPERVVTLTFGMRVFEFNSQYLPAGSKARKKSICAKSRIVGSGAVYAINPAIEEDIIGEIGANGDFKEVIELAPDTTEPQDLPF